MGDYDFFTEVIKNPTAATFRAAFQYVSSLPGYDPYSQDFNEINALIGKQENRAALERARDAMPNRVLSPRQHMMLAAIHKRLNNEEGAHMENVIARQCFLAMAATGDGSEARPYLVTCVEDEYDMLQWLSKKHTSQTTLETSDGRHLDVMQCDGGDIYFDITVMRKALDRQFGA